MVLVKTQEQFVLFAKMILVLVVMMIAWKYLLRPVRGFFSLSGLGVNGLVFIGHGRSNAHALVSAIKVARQTVEANLLGSIQSAIQESLQISQVKEIE